MHSVAFLSFIIYVLHFWTLLNYFTGIICLLIAFLPIGILCPSGSFSSFESWVRRKVLDTTKYKHNLGIIGNNGIANKTCPYSHLGPEINRKVYVDLSWYETGRSSSNPYEERLKFLSSSVGKVCTIFFINLFYIIIFLVQYKIIEKTLFSKWMLSLRTEKLEGKCFSVKPKNEDIFEKKRLKVQNSVWHKLIYRCFLLVILL